jgi:uncharacterized membrane protein YeaQ/YmgE (transglycosylase-associated protein family)
MHMTLVSLLILLVVAGVCGGIGQAIAGRSRGGFITSIALGFIGALLGAWIAAAAKLPELYTLTVGGEHFPIVWSIIGAAILVAAISLFSRRRHTFA